ncbi:MAG: hypothetical protein ABW063_14140 [Caulobacter sp.]
MTISTAISQPAKPAANTDAVLFGPVSECLRASVTISAVNQAVTPAASSL